MEQRRIFVGGLIKEVTEEELHEKLSRFGTVGSVDIKTRHSETEHKTFAYVNLTADENGFKKCFTAYNNTKWKGGQLKLQFAKESFLDKLKQEQKEAKEVKTADHGCTHAIRNPLLEGNNVKALPGTPVDEDGKWIMGKYSRVLPVLKVKNPTVKKLVTLDPSKMIHQLKKLKTDDDSDSASTRQDASQLTWALEEKDSLTSKKRQGIFPEWKSPKKEKKDAASMANRLKQIASEQSVLDTEMEVVPMGKTSQKSTARVLVNNGNGYNSDSSVGSADTDEILTKPASKKKPSGSPVKKPGKSQMADVTDLDTSASKRKKKEALLTKDSHPALSANSTPVNKCANGVSPAPDGKKITKTPSAVKSVQKKAENDDSVKSDSKSKSNSGAKMPVQEKTEIDDSNESDSEHKSKSGAVHQQFKFVTPTAQGKCFRKAASLARTPPFRGLGMLSGASVEIGHDKQAEQPMSLDTSLTQTGLKVVKKTSESPVSVDTKPSSKTPSLTLSTKSPTSAVETKKHAETPRARTFSGGSETIHTPDSAKISSPKAARSKKKSRQAEEESDSDLDDNDLEKVCKKLAARSKPQDQSAGLEKRRHEEAEKSPAESSKKKKKNSDVVKGNESFNSMDTSHLNHKKNQEALVKQESLVTKMIREGAGSKRVKFSDDETESVTQEQETSNLELSERKLNLFDSDSDEEDGEIKIEIQPQFHGKKGMKLLELQSKFKDNRFKMDDRFQQTESEEEPEEGAISEEFTELSEEKKKSMEILEKVLGYKPRERRRPQIIDMNQIRYDPTKPSSMEITNTKSGDKVAVPKTENKTKKNSDVETDVGSKKDYKTKKQNGMGGDISSASKDNVSDDSDNEASSNDESDADSESEKEDSEEGSDSEKVSSVNDSEEVSSDDNSNDDTDDSTSSNEDEELERQQSGSSSAVDEQEEENVTSDEDPTDDEDDDEDIKYSLGKQNLTEHLVAINEEEEEAETSSDDNDEEEEEASSDEDPTDDEDVKYSIGKQNLTEQLADIDEEEEEEADTSSDDEEEEEASSDEDSADDDEEVKYSIGKQNELATERQSDVDEEDEEDEEEASSDEDSADNEDVKYSIGKQNKLATERQADVVDDDVSDDSVDDDDAGVSDDQDSKNEGDKAVKSVADSAVSKPSLGNLFAGGDSFSFFDEPPAKKKKELQPQADGVKSTEKDSKVAVVSAKRKLCSSPNFCLTKDSSRLQAGQQALKSELDVKDYPELRREYQTLVRELHKKAVRKQKKHQLWQDKTNKRRNSKFKGAARRKKNKH